MLTRPTPGSCEIFCASVVSARSSTFESGSDVGRQREREDRRVGGIDLAVDRRIRKILRQKIGSAVDGGLHFLLGDVDVRDRDRIAA